MAKPIGKTALVVVSPEPGRKRSHLVLVTHTGGGWYKAECMGESKRCRSGECLHSRGMRWSTSLRPIKQIPPRRPAAELHGKRQRTLMREWWYWRCTICGQIKTYLPAPAGPRKPVCDYGHHPAQSMERVEVAAPQNQTGRDDG